MNSVAKLRLGPSLPGLLLLAVIPLFLVRGTSDPSTYSKLAATCILLALIPFWSRRSPYPDGQARALNNHLLLALSVFIVIQALSLLRSNLLEEGLWTLMLRALPGFVALLVFRASASFSQAMRNLSRAATLGILVQCTVGGFQYFNLGFESLPGSPFLPQGTLANKNIFSAWLAMALPLAAFGFTDGSRSWRRMAMAAVFAGTGLVTFAYSRTGWLILAGFLATGVAGLWFLQGSNESRTLRRALMTAVVATILALLWDAWQPPRHLEYRRQATYGDFSDRFSSIAVPGDLRNQHRLELWSHTLAMAIKSPWFGIGAGGWKTSYPAYAAASAKQKPFSDLGSANFETFPASPHNDFLLIGAESGVPGLLGYLSVFGAALAMLVKARRGLGRHTPFALPCLISSLGAYLLDATFNFPGERLEPALMLGMVLGTVSLTKNEEIHFRQITSNETDSTQVGLKTGRRWAWRTVDLTAAALAICGLGLCLARWHADAHLQRGLEARNKQNWPAAENELVHADRPWYRLDRSGTPVAFYRATIALQEGNREVAKKLLERAYSVNPEHIHVLNDLGSLEVAAGHFKEGITWYEKCLVLRPDFSEARQNLAAAWFNAGQLHKAKETLALIPPQSRTPLAQAYARRVNELLMERSEYE